MKVSDGLQALAKIEERINLVQRGHDLDLKLFKVVFTDYSMPNMNGPELMSRIRSLYQDLVADGDA